MAPLALYQGPLPMRREVVAAGDLLADAATRFASSSSSLGRDLLVEPTALHVDADPVHILEAFCHVGHRRRHAEEARAPETDDRLTGRTGAEGEITTDLLDESEIRLRVVMGVEVPARHAGRVVA